MDFGNNFGSGFGNTDRRNQKEEYFVVPQPRQRNPQAQPDRWAVVKGYDERGGTVVQTFSTKSSAQNRAQQLARNNKTSVTIYDAAKKSSRFFNYG